MTVLIFVGKLILASGFLYGYYHFFLRNKRFHHYNRFYLLGISLLSVIIPFLQIPVFFLNDGIEKQSFIKTLAVINGSRWEEDAIAASTAQAGQWLDGYQLLLVIYCAGAVTGFYLFIKSLTYINKLSKKYPLQAWGEIKFYHTLEPDTPFSFFKRIFWNNDIDTNSEKGKQIMRHELFHVQQKHSADVVLMQVLCCLAWFNPFFHLIKKELRAIHEFLADAHATAENNPYEYAELLLTQAIQQKSNLVHPFFQNPLKRRIIMLTQTNPFGRKAGYVSRIMVLPLLFIIGSAFALKFPPKKTVPVPSYSSKTIIAVIDAGHGGNFPGCRNLKKNLFEKDLTLAIAKKIKELSSTYNVNVVLTRERDELINGATNLKEDLQNRVAILKNAKADMFVSIHVNAAPQAVNTTLSGFEANITAKKQDNNSRLLSSAILAQLADIYTVDTIIKQREIGIHVLDNSTVPSALVQCGYLTNPKDAAFISDPANQEKVARKILEGIVNYTNQLSKEEAAAK